VQPDNNSENDHNPVLSLLASAKPSLEHLLPLLNEAGLRTKSDVDRIINWGGKHRQTFFLKIMPELTKVEAYSLCIIFEIAESYN
jgi:hypothetical protein